MHEKDESFGGRYRPMQSVGDDLQDSNEQEMEKSGFWERMRKREATHNSVPPSKSPMKRQSAPIPIDGKRLPVKRPEERTLTEKEKEARAIQAGRDENKTEGVLQEPPKKKKGRGAPLFFRWILITSLLASLLILTVALVAGRLYTDALRDAQNDSDSSVSANNPDERPTSEEEKIIFVKQYDDASGLLTTPELYSRCADTVVSIVSKNGAASGIGSGLILTRDGYIATAYHVVEGMSELTVVLSDQTAYSATLIQGDELTDLAVLKIEGSNLPTVEFGESGKLLTGEKVVAIGTPASMDYAGSLCSGEISYLSRTVKIYDQTNALQKKMTLLQTNAPVNPGNSGCPLFDEYGRVVGIVTMKLGTDYSGIGFAIPSDGALPILQAMMKGETLTDSLRSAVSVPAPKLGIVGERDEENGISGIRILRFSNENVSAASTLKAGDLILQIDGQGIQTVQDVSAAIHSKNPNDSVLVTVLRSGQQLSFNVILGK